MNLTIEINKSYSGINANKNDQYTKMYSSKMDSKGTAKSKTIKAGNININGLLDEKYDNKKNFARRQAMKLISDAWSKDEVFSDRLNMLDKQKNHTLDEVNLLNKQMDDIMEQKAASVEEFGESTDVSEYDDIIDELGKSMQKKENELAGIRQSGSNVRISRLKSQNMIKAKEAADNIIEESDKEILASLIKDGKDLIEEKFEENFEEKFEENDEPNSLDADEINDTSESKLENAQNNIDRLLLENNLIDEDIKGIKIDFRLK